jgi:DNA-binding CsgD family transcriptional regulator
MHQAGYPVLVPRRFPRWRPSPSSLATIADACELTSSELRVLRAVTEIDGVTSIAAALGVSRTTIRTHLRNLFQKTGAKGQADLIRLVVAVDSSLSGHRDASTEQQLGERFDLPAGAVLVRVQIRQEPGRQ